MTGPRRGSHVGTAALWELAVHGWSQERKPRGDSCPIGVGSVWLVPGEEAQVTHCSLFPRCARESLETCETRRTQSLWCGFLSELTFWGPRSGAGTPSSSVPYPYTQMHEQAYVAENEAGSDGGDCFSEGLRPVYGHRRKTLGEGRSVWIIAVSPSKVSDLEKDTSVSLISTLSSVKWDC